MNCKPGDLVMVVRSEVGNDGRVGRVAARCSPGQKLPNGVIAYPTDDWIVEGRFNTADDHVLVLFGQDVARWEENRHEVDALPFPDSWLRPIRGDGLTDDTPAEVDQPQTVGA
jgi:hypothetical protein